MQFCRVGNISKLHLTYYNTDDLLCDIIDYITDDNWTDKIENNDVRGGAQVIVTWNNNYCWISVVLLV